MITVHAPIFHVPGLDERLRMATITIRRGDEWQTAPVVMRAAAAIELADECQKRGLTVKLESL